MPYDSLKDLPETIQSVLPLKAQEIFLAAFNSAYDSTCESREDREECSNAIAWGAVKESYEKDDKGEWVEIGKGEYMADITGTADDKYQIDIGVINNAGAMIKVRTSWFYLSENEILDEDTLKEKLAQEMGYSGMGTHAIFDYMPDLRVGDEIVDVEPLYTVDISVYAQSSICTCEIKDDMWIPVAALGQSTDMVFNGKNITVSLNDEAAFVNSIGTWKGGYINVNHEDNSIVPDFKIEDAKYKDGMLYLKPESQEAFDFIRQEASTGRSIETKVIEVDKDGVVTAFEGRGLSVLFAPHKPVCTKAMGCFSTSKKSTIKEVFDTLTSKAKSNLSFGKVPKKDIGQETTMTEETDKLKSQLTKAETARDEAQEEANLLKASLSEKDELIEEQKATIAKFEEAEAKRKEAEFEADWNTLKASMPPGLTHKPEDEAAYKQKLRDDPVGFAVEMANLKFESARGKDGAEFESEETTAPNTTGVYDPVTRKFGGK
jgi:cation transport regulator